MHKLVIYFDAFATCNEAHDSCRQHFSKNLFQTSKNHEETIISHEKILN